MIPILYTFTSSTPFSQGVLYLLALALVAYAGWAGWRAAMVDEDSKKPASRRRTDRLMRAGMYAVLGGALARFGLYYALPASAFLGSKGEGIPIHTYGILLATGFISAVTLAAHLAEQEWRGEEGQIKRDQIFDLAFWVFLSGVGGSKLLFMIVNWKDYGPHLGEYFSSPERLVELLGGGLVFYGGLIGASIAAYIYARVHKFNFLRLADLAIPTVSLGQCLGRLGCFSAGCCWGDVGGRVLKWGVHFPGAAKALNLFGQNAGVESMAYQSQAMDTRYVLESSGQIFHDPKLADVVQISRWAVEHGFTLPVHPTQLYESIGQFILFVALMSLRGSRRFHGQIFALWLMCYAVLRGTVELFRGDVERGTLHGLLGSFGTSVADKIPLEAWYNLSTSQFISICMFALGATLLYRHGSEVLFRPTPGPAAPAAA